MLGKTPFNLTVSSEFVTKLRAGETVNLEFLSRGGISTQPLTLAQIDEGAPLRAEVRSGRKSDSKGTAARSRDKKASSPKKTSKPKSKKKWGW